MANSDINTGAGFIASLNLDGQQQLRLRKAAREMGLTEQQAGQMIRRAVRKIERKGKDDSVLGQVVDSFITKGAKVAQLEQDMPEILAELRTVDNRVVASGEQGNQDTLQNFGGRDGQGNIKDVEQQLREMAGAEGRVDPNVIKRSRWDKAKGEFVVDEFYAADGVPIPAEFQEAAKQRDFGLQVPNTVAPAQQVLAGELARLQQGIDTFGADAFGPVPDPQRGVGPDVPDERTPVFPKFSDPNIVGTPGQPYTAMVPGAAGVAGRIEDDLFGGRGAEQALVRELIKQDKDGLAAEEIQRRANLQVNREFDLETGGIGADNKPYRRIAADGTFDYERRLLDAARPVREAQVLSEQSAIRQNAEQVEANNWRAQAAANIIGQDFVVGGRGAVADQAIANIGNIAQLGPAKVGYDFQVSNNPVDRGTAIPNSLPLNLPDQYNSPITDNRFAGPLQRQEQWLVDNSPEYRQGNSFGDYPQVAIGQQLGAAQAAIEGINFGTKSSPRNLSLGQGAIRNLDDLQGAVDQAVSLGQQQGVKFYDFVDGNNVYVENPGINEVLRKGGINDNQMRDIARGLFALEASRRNPANQVSKNFYQAGMGEPGRPVEFGGNHPALGGGMVNIAQLRGEKIGGQEVRGKLQALTGRVGNDTPLSASELADARMPMIGGVAGQDIPRAAFVRAPVMGPGPARAMSEDAVYERFGPVNGQIANAVIQRFEQAQGSNPDGFGVRVERQRNMDPETEMGGSGNGGTRRPTAAASFTPGPDPWSQPIGTGNGITQEIQKRSSSPQKALPYGIQSTGPSQGPTRPLTNELKNELAALSSGYSEQGPVPGSARKQFTDRARNFGKSPKYERANRYGRRSAMVGGAVAGLAGIDGLINGERNRREEEQYQ